MWSLLYSRYGSNTVDIEIVYLLLIDQHSLWLAINIKYLGEAERWAIVKSQSLLFLRMFSNRYRIGTHAHNIKQTSVILSRAASVQSMLIEIFLSSWDKIAHLPFLKQIWQGNVFKTYPRLPCLLARALGGYAGPVTARQHWVIQTNKPIAPL